ncbi:MAG: cadmium-translocating P-type ATPase [Acidobacteriia bacterium]|nr:cadmium-translocating P-type ATPase [Terriglobia bacterium]
MSSRIPQLNEIGITLMAGVSILAYLVARFAFGLSGARWELPLYLTLAIGGGHLLIELGRKVRQGEWGADLLAGISILASVLTGEYLVGAIIVLMLSGGTALERAATRRASSVLDALAKRMPVIAHRQTDSGLIDVPLDRIAIGDALVILPHEICPVDGVVSDGRGRMDESYLTGEPFEMSKTPGSLVISGAINGETALTIAATKLPVDSRYAKIMNIVAQAEANRPRLRRISERLGAWYTPLALAVAIAGWAASGDPRRFLSVLVIATPCPLLISIPVAIVGAISLAAQRGILVKNPAALEHIDACETLIFDKTGTLTFGRPSLTEIVLSNSPQNGARPGAPALSRSDVLKIVASLEQYSKHPLAGAVMRAAEEEQLSMEPVSLVNERPGEGLTGIVSGREVKITGRGSYSGIEDLPPLAPGLECVALIDGHYAALLRFRDEPRQDSRSYVLHLGLRHPGARVILLSGDRVEEVQYLAETVGITEVHGGKSPEEKLAIVIAETLRGRTLYVGDGINDAPAMQAATVGIAFGHSSDITAEAADAVILEATLRKVDELVHIGRRMRRIALQSAVGGMVLSAGGMILAAAGYLPPVAGAVAQELIDLATVLNAVRVSLPRGELSDV